MFATIALYAPVQSGVDVTFRVDTLPDSSCRLTRSGNGQATINTSWYGVGTWGYFLPTWRNSNAWPTGTYQVSATCSLSGVNITSSAIAVTIP
jgi:hypothetical protein